MLLQPDQDEFTRQELRLERCPAPEQVMPPANTVRNIPFALAVFGNVIAGSLLLATMLLLPVLLAGLMPPL